MTVGNRSSKVFATFEVSTNYPLSVISSIFRQAELTGFETFEVSTNYQLSIINYQLLAPYLGKQSSQVLKPLRSPPIINYQLLAPYFGYQTSKVFETFEVSTNYQLSIINYPLSIINSQKNNIKICINTNFAVFNFYIFI